jgi:ATP-dependent protease HslVU (ClpYQ) peptidase subunit
MTTIVKVGKAIAIDSRITENGIVLDDDFRKYAEDENNVYLFTGSMCNFEEMAKLYSSNSMSEKPDLFIDTTMLTFNKKNGDVTQIKTDKETKALKVSPVSCHTYCVGSGRKYAYGVVSYIQDSDTQLDDELIAKKAIQSASKHDLYTCDNIKTWSAVG